MFIEPIVTRIMITNEDSRANEENMFSMFNILFVVGEITLHPMGLCVNTKKRPKPLIFYCDSSQSASSLN